MYIPVYSAGLWKLEVSGTGIVCLNSKSYVVKKGDSTKKFSAKGEIFIQ